MRLAPDRLTVLYLLPLPMLPLSGDQPAIIMLLPKNAQGADNSAPFFWFDRTAGATLASRTRPCRGAGGNAGKRACHHGRQQCYFASTNVS